MLRYLKKHRKLPHKLVPPEGATHQITDVGAERSKDPEGEYRLRKIPGLMRLVGLIRL